MDQASSPWGGILVVYTFGYFHQLPLVAMKSINSSKSAKKLESADLVGIIPLHNLSNRQDGSGTQYLVVIMDRVVR